MSDLILTQKQQLYINYYNRGMNGTQAVKTAYNITNDNVAAVIASQNLRKPKIAQALVDLRVESNIMLVDSIRVLGEGMNANKYIGGVETNMPDHRIRLRASEKALKLLKLT
jgi:phage terminase small subunit